jgi:hypothetical protein
MDAGADRIRLAQLREAAVQHFRQDAPDDRYYRYLLNGIGEAAQAYAERNEIEPDRFEHVIDDGLEAVRHMRYAFVDYDEKPSGKFWADNAFPLDLIKADKVPKIDRSSFEASVGMYLALPYRAQALDRFLIRALIAMEFYAFGNEMLNEKTFGTFPSRSPLKQRHAVLQYLMNNFFNALLFGGVAAAAIWAHSAGVLGETATGWITGICVALFLLFAALSTLSLPLLWVRQFRARRNVYDLLSAMDLLYREQRTDGPVSARYVNDRAKEAATKGVVWPAPLFALLDDVLARSGRY